MQICLDMLLPEFHQVRALNLQALKKLVDHAFCFKHLYPIEVLAVIAQAGPQLRLIADSQGKFNCLRFAHPAEADWRPEAWKLGACTYVCTYVGV